LDFIGNILVEVIKVIYRTHYQYVSDGKAYSLRWWTGGVLVAAIELFSSLALLYLTVFVIISRRFGGSDWLSIAALALVLLLLAAGAFYLVALWWPVLYGLTKQRDDSGNIIAAESYHAGKHFVKSDQYDGILKKNKKP